MLQELGDKAIQSRLYSLGHPFSLFFSVEDLFLRILLVAESVQVCSCFQTILI